MYGASLAWWLARAGEAVTIVDQFDPGDARASSGGETRLYRCAHGPDSEYTTMARRGRALWRQLEEESGEELLVECGLAWFAHRDDGWETESERTLREQGSLGVKAALDDEGPGMDPDADLPSTTNTEPEVRAYLHERFPALEHAPLVGARSCRYELTPDTRLIAAPHPANPDVWLVGGGSGHGFKHGPPMAERLAAAFTGETPLPSHFGLGERSRSRSLRTASSGTRT